MLPQCKLPYHKYHKLNILNKLPIENCAYEPKSAQSLTSQPLFIMKYFENKSHRFFMFVLQDRYQFVLVLVNWLTEKIIMIYCFISMECDCHIFSKYLVFQMKNPVFQLKCLVFQSKNLDFDQNTKYLETEILKYQVFHAQNFKYQVFQAKYLVFQKRGILKLVPRKLLCPLVIFVCCKCLDYNEDEAQD